MEYHVILPSRDSTVRHAMAKCAVFPSRDREKLMKTRTGQQNTGIPPSRDSTTSHETVKCMDFPSRDHGKHVKTRMRRQTPTLFHRVTRQLDHRMENAHGFPSHDRDKHRVRIAVWFRNAAATQNSCKRPANAGRPRTGTRERPARGLPKKARGGEKTPRAATA